MILIKLAVGLACVAAGVLLLKAAANVLARPHRRPPGLTLGTLFRTDGFRSSVTAEGRTRFVGSRGEEPRYWGDGLWRRK